MIRLLLIALTATGIATASSAQIEVTTHTLDNGMDIVVIPDNRAPVVTHMVWYRVGAADEPPGKSGIAHYLEHLMFKGTEAIPDGEFSDIIAANGGEENAFTSQDYTGYFQRIAADRLALVMELEADRMQNLVISEDSWLAERDVILEERRSRVDASPGAMLAEQRTAALYMNHPYSTPIIGWEHEIDMLTRQDALDFYDLYYAPNNAILIVAGDVEPDEVIALAEEHYGPAEPSDSLPERVRPQEPPQLSPRRLSYTDPRVRQPYIVRSYLATERDAGAQDEAAALSILADLLGGGVTSVLNEDLVLDQQIALSAGAFYGGTALDTTSFGFFVVPTVDTSLEDAEAALDASLARFLEEGPDPEALERIKVQVRASEIYARDSLQGLARTFGTALTSGLAVEDVLSWPDTLAAVTEEDVMTAARNLLDLRRSVTASLLQPDVEPEPVSVTTQTIEADDEEQSE
ncbi:putative zinc protease [Pontivivens insulae]|uniref:Putative zinc protease n=1 Tax=Pontivivens insulae TaxID=1639689 RepID=A0A2R8A892_9RHOB|nr:zinc protease [Pontivivens insulae]SPF28457.1 putative zinc protease [Pontivivens insulae]